LTFNGCNITAYYWFLQEIEVKIIYLTPAILAVIPLFFGN